MFADVKWHASPRKVQVVGCYCMLLRRRWLSHMVNTMQHRKRMQKRSVPLTSVQMLLCIADRTYHPEIFIRQSASDI